MNQNMRWIMWSLALAVAGWLAIFGDKTPSDELVEVVPVRPQSPALAGEVADGAAPVTPQPETLLPGQLMRLGKRTTLDAVTQNGIDLFALAANQEAASPPSDPEPTAPPPPEQPFVLIGRMLDSGRWHAFLERDGASYVLAAGDEAAGYRIDAISKTEVRLTRLADKARLVIPIDGDMRD